MDPEEVTRVILHVGDISNCYDELDHDDCPDGVDWALSKMPQWHRPADRPRRAIDRYSVDRFSRKDITVGPDLTRERTTIELSTSQVLSVFHRYSVFDVCGQRSRARIRPNRAGDQKRVQLGRPEPSA